MKSRCLVISLVLIVFLMSVTSVCAQDNGTDIMGQDIDDENVMAVSNDEDTLEKTYFYDADGDEYVDDTVVTHNVEKYYGDGKNFKVTVYDDDYIPMDGVYVSFSFDGGKYKEKTTDANGNVYFPLNYKAGKYIVETYIETEDGTGFWSAYNTVKIKSTIHAKDLVKYSTSKKKFKIKFVDTKGKKLADTYVKIKKNGKWHRLKTDKNGYVKIKSNFKVGKNKIVVYNPVSKEKRKVPVYVLKKGVHKIKVKIVDSYTTILSKKLKNGDYIDTIYETEYRQYNPGVYVQANGGGLTDAKHTKLLKAKFYFKNKNTGKIITKTSKKVKYDGIVIKPIKGYVPYKATVWYKDRK